MKYKQLTVCQRSQIYILSQAKKKKSQIAAIIGVHKSTITREMRRNRGKRGYYGYVEAHKRAEKRKRRIPKFTKLTLIVIEKIRTYLAHKWSPEQISGYLKKNENISISHETIYKYIYEDKKQNGTLYKSLRWQNNKYYPRYKSNDKRGHLPNRRSIDQRPEVVDLKQRFGDWEADTMMGKNHKGALVTIVERLSKYTLIAQVENKSAELVTEAIVRLLKPFKGFVHSLTVDNGKEFAFHKEIEKKLNTFVYFAHPYASYERGLNENTNGLIRQFLPKKTVFNEQTRNQLSLISSLLNLRPRKTLNFNNPTDIMIQSVYSTN
jgi:IS30 family transposase